MLHLACLYVWYVANTLRTVLDHDKLSLMLIHLVGLSYLYH